MDNRKTQSFAHHSWLNKIGLQLRGRPILLITRMITDRIGLHSVLLPLRTAIIRENTIPSSGGSFEIQDGQL